MIKFDDGKYFAYDMIGEFRSSGEWIHPKRNIKSYELIFVLDGNLYIAEENTKFVVKKNEFIVLEPFKEHYGYKKVSQYTSFYWFHFFTDIQLPVKNYLGTDIYEIKQLLKRLLHISNTPFYSTAALDSAGYMVFEELKRLSADDNSSNSVLNSQNTEYNGLIN